MWQSCMRLLPWAETPKQAVPPLQPVSAGGKGGAEEFL